MQSAGWMYAIARERKDANSRDMLIENISWKMIKNGPLAAIYHANSNSIIFLKQIKSK